LAVSAFGQTSAHISTTPEVAQGAVFEIRLSGIGPLSPADVSAVFPLRMELNGVSVVLSNASEGSQIQAFLLSTDRALVRALLPSETPLGPTNVVLTVAGGSYGTVLTVVRKKFTFLRHQVGADWWTQDRGSAAQVDPNGQSSSNQLTSPAHPGDILEIFGTGLGAVTGDEQKGPLPADLNTHDFDVIIGGIPVRIFYAGRSGCCAGLDQMNVEVPSAVEGCFVPVWFHDRNTQEVDEVNVSISESGECPDLPHNARVTLDTRGPLNLGYIDFTAGGAAFGPGPYSEAPPGTCRTGGAPSGTEFSYYDFTHASAGPALNFQTPQGLEHWFWSSYGSGYLAPDYGRHQLVPGHYVIDNGQGGEPVGPFSTAVDLSPISFRWTNADDLAAGLMREKDFEVDWNGGNPLEGFVTIYGTWEYGSDHYPGYMWAGFDFTCVADASKGHFTVPSYVWSGIRSNAFTDFYFGQTIFVCLNLSVAFQSRSRFTGPGLDLGLGFSYVAKYRSIKFQ
jgi:uncharacterized protein (TIGR03437 family)